MRETGCTVCRRSLTETRDSTKTTEFYTLQFDPTVCGFCAVTLARALEGVTLLLQQSHGEKRERVIDRLSHQLEQQGFDVSGVFTPRRRTA